MFFTHQRVLLQQREERNAGPERRSDHGRHGILEPAQQTVETAGAAHQRTGDVVRAAGDRRRVHAPARHTPDDPGADERCKHRLRLLLKYTKKQKKMANKYIIILYFFFIIIIII